MGNDRLQAEGSQKIFRTFPYHFISVFSPHCEVHHSPPSNPSVGVLSLCNRCCACWYNSFLTVVHRRRGQNTPGSKHYCQVILFPKSSDCHHREDQQKSQRGYTSANCERSFRCWISLKWEGMRAFSWEAKEEEKKTYCGSGGVWNRERRGGGEEITR